MELGKVQARGQITVPRAIREAAGINPGDIVAFVVTSPGRVELRALPRMRLRDALTRYHISLPIDDGNDRAAWQSRAAEDVLGA